MNAYVLIGEVAVGHREQMEARPAESDHLCERVASAAPSTSDTPAALTALVRDGGGHRRLRVTRSRHCDADEDGCLRWMAVTANACDIRYTHLKDCYLGHCSCLK